MFNILRRLSQVNVLRGASYMLIASIIVNLTRVLLVVLLSRYYTKEEFGIWATITSTAAVIATGDFGITNALRNKMSILNANGEEGQESARKYFYSSFFFLICLTGVLILLISLLRNYIPFGSFFETDNLILKNKGAEIFFYIQILFLINIPLSIGTPLFFSYQESYLNALFAILQAIFSFIIVSVLAYCRYDLVTISIMYFIGNIIVSLIGTSYFIVRRKWFTYKFVHREFWSQIRELLPIGLRFMLLQIGSSLMQNAGTICISSSIGVAAAAEFNVAQKICTFFVAIYQSIFNPMWGAYAYAIAQQNIIWCKKMLKRSSLITALIFAAFIVFIMFFGNYFISLLAGEQYKTNSILFLYLGLISMFYILYANVSLLQNATNKINSLLVFNYLGALVLIPLINSYASILGINGVSIALAVFWMLGFILMYYRACYQLNRL